MTEGVLNGVAPTEAPAGASVVICGYTEDRWDALSRAVRSAAGQVPPPAELIVVIDHNPGLLARAATAFADVATVIPNGGARGLSGARNAGFRRAGGRVVAFLDDDAQAAPGWLAALTEPFADPGVVGTGGHAAPAWASRRPGWLPEEFLWVVGCSYRGLPTGRAQIRNPIGANMAFLRSALEDAGGFSEGIGRDGAIPLGCEETEISIRIRERTGGGRILLVPEAGVSHLVGADRCTWRYFARRCWFEGRSKALVAAAVGSGPALASERAHVLRALPNGVLLGLRDALRGRPAGLARAAAIVAGTAATAAGYASGRATTLAGRTA